MSLPAIPEKSMLGLYISYSRQKAELLRKKGDKVKSRALMTLAALPLSFLCLPNAIGYGRIKNLSLLVTFPYYMAKGKLPRLKKDDQLVDGQLSEENFLDLLQEKAFVNYSKGRFRQGSSSPLLYACYAGYKLGVETILKEKVNVNKVGNANLFLVPYFQVEFEKISPLMVCMHELRGPREEIALLLLKQDGIDISYKTPLGLTAMHYASMLGSIRVVKKLLSKDANLFDQAEYFPLDPKVKCVKTPIEMALYANHLPLVNFFLKKGAKLPKKNHPVFIDHLLKEGCTEMLFFLQENGFSVKTEAILGSYMDNLTHYPKNAGDITLYLSYPHLFKFLSDSQISILKEKWRKFSPINSADCMKQIFIGLSKEEGLKVGKSLWMFALLFFSEDFPLFKVNFETLFKHWKFNKKEKKEMLVQAQEIIYKRYGEKIDSTPYFIPEINKIILDYICKEPSEKKEEEKKVS